MSADNARLDEIDEELAALHGACEQYEQAIGLRTSPKAEYREHLLDGLYVLHNPFAKNPVPAHLLSHDRVAQIRGAGPSEFTMDAPADFLLMRTLMSTTVRNPGRPRGG